MEMKNGDYWNELRQSEQTIKDREEVSQKVVKDFAHYLSGKYHIPYKDCYKDCITACNRNKIKIKENIIVTIAGYVFGAIFLIALASPDFIMWMVSIEFILDHIGLKYADWNYLIPFSIIQQGENMAIPFIITVIVAILIVILCIAYKDRVLVPFVIFEILAPGVVVYLILWMRAVCWILISLGITNTGRGLPALLIQFAIIVAIHLLVYSALKLNSKIKTRLQTN